MATPSHSLHSTPTLHPLFEAFQPHSLHSTPTLHPLFEAFQQRSNALYIALKTLQHGIHSEIAAGPVELVPTPSETTETDSEAEQTQ
jgi:hypothetical protein